MKKLIIISLLFVSLFSKDTDVLATVNKSKITVLDLKELINSIPNMNYEKMPEGVQEKALDQLIDKQILIQYTKNKKIERSQEFKKAIRKIKSDLIVQVWLSQEMKNTKVSNKEVKSFYDKNKRVYFSSKQEIKAKHILVKEKKDTKSILKSLKGLKGDKLQDKFIELAKSKSTGPSGANGGDLGWFSAEKMVPEFSEAAFKLKKGSYTKKPVKTQFGYHIIYIEDKKKASVAKFSEVKEKIKESLKQQKFAEKIQKTIKKLRKKAKISIK